MRAEKDKGRLDWLSRNLGRALFAIVAAAVVLALAAAFTFRAHVGTSIVNGKVEEWGQAGDFFGGILNPAFGFLTIVALVLTLLLQSKELKMSREELALSRSELEKSAEALKGQNKTIDRQNFEQTFFSWLSTYGQMLDSVENTGSHLFGDSETLEGKRALARWWSEYLAPRHFMDVIREKLPDQFDGNADSVTLLRSLEPGQYGLITKQALDWCDEMSDKIERQVDSLFRILYRLIVWVDSQDEERLSLAQKWLYVSIIRARLSSIELVFLFYNGHTPRGHKFKRLIEKYALFDNLNFGPDPVLWMVRQCPPDGKGYAATAYESGLARVALGLPKSGEETLALASNS